MGQSFVGEIRMFASNFAPAGWMFCNGQLLDIAQYDTLFAVIGTSYGGDGQVNFALPDMRGRVPLHQGNNFVFAETSGSEDVTLSLNQIPTHSHTLVATNVLASQETPGDNLTGQTEVAFYGEDAPFFKLKPQTVTTVGNTLPHTNLQPFLCINFIISLYGIFPQQQN